MPGVGPTPITAPHQLDIEYTVDGKTHLCQLRCSAVLVSGSYELEDYGGGTTPVAGFVASFVALAAPLFKTTSTFDIWTLQQYNTGAYIPIATGSIGSAGSGTGANSLTSQMTFTYKDGLYNDVKIVLLEGAGITVPYKAAQTALGGAFATFANAFMDLSAGAMGSIVRSRANSIITAQRFLTTSLNRTLRRERGLL